MTVALLLAGTAAAMVLTQHLRHDGPVASSIHWKTRPGPRYRVCFRLTRDDTVKVAVVDSADHLVRVLASDQPLTGSDTAHCFAWNGRDAAGNPVPPGSYHLQLTLQDADRTAVSGERLDIPAAGGSP
ncbi:MAG TPA: FlgD immunoglobulin-like domain containing protein [Solirubrobacterales bacterium]|nr:FlgD immunoglobulin-like domain containing protein [Solirubrobacterales bacterium]